MIQTLASNTGSSTGRPSSSLHRLFTMGSFISAEIAISFALGQSRFLKLMMSIRVTAALLALCISVIGDDRSSGWWSVQPVQEPPVPTVTGEDAAWCRNPLDHFVVQSLRAHELGPSPMADPQALCRRLFYDLTGLPPSPEQVDAFVMAAQRDFDAAYAALVEALLESPAYGERWARHWLDIAHYADTHGFERDRRRDNAWPYRDYVIRALNDDKPYDQFLCEQIAGDVLSPGDPDCLVATGFLAAGPWDLVGHEETKSPVQRRAARTLDLDDMATQVMTSTVAITVNCARCHDHKLDPISQKEYYQLVSVFAGLKRKDRPIVHSGKDGIENASMIFGIVADSDPPIVHLLDRGDPESPLEEVSPAAPSWIKSPAPEIGSSRMPEGERRVALANWITHRDNPLTRRVIANRLWHWHFGQGLVATPSDFGNGGSLPSHPQLLDFLATKLLEEKWSLKAMHRLIVTSATYRQTSQASEDALAIDSGNRLLWRMSPRRLAAEEVRDAVLAVSGKLNREMFGPGYRDFDYQEEYAPVYRYRTADTPELWRRSIYRFVVRSTPHGFMNALDCPDPAVMTPKRLTTTTAAQTLALFNNDFMLRQSAYFAERLQSVSTNFDEQITLGFKLAFARPPETSETVAAHDLIQSSGLATFCRALFNANEFVYLD